MLNQSNPFNSTATISYTIPTDGQVIIKLYDILGREMKTLLNEYSEAGEFRFSFEASDLSSGIYLLQLQMNNHYVNQKIILMK